MLQTSIKSPFVSCHILLTSGSKALLVRRAHEPLKGWWGLPGGLVEPGESLVEAVTRELHEETGLSLEGVPTMVGLMESMITADAGVVHYVTFLYHSGLKSMPVPVAGDDAGEARWVEEAVIPSLRLTDMAHRTLEQSGFSPGPFPDMRAAFPEGLRVLTHDVQVTGEGHP